MAKAAAASQKDVEVIVYDGDIVTLDSGTKVRLLPLKARQFFKLLRIVTHGAGGMLFNVKFSGDDTPEEFGAKLVAVLGYAIPDADEEVFDFLLSMVEPVDLKTGRNLNKQDKETNEKLKEEIFDELYNPELEDMVTLIEAIVKREAEDLQALGKRLMALFSLAQKTGQVPDQMLADKTPTASED
jgi:hypothetical protein